MSAISNERPAFRASHALILVCGALLVAAVAAAAMRSTGLRAPDRPVGSASPVPAQAAAPQEQAPVVISEEELARERRLGLDDAERGDAASALERLVPVYQARPDDAVALAIAEASLSKRDFRTAKVVLSALQSPETPEALRVRGMLHEQAGQLTEALTLYDRAIPNLPRPHVAQESRARVLAWLGRFDDAAAAYAALAADEHASLGVRQRCRVRLAELTAWKKDLDGALRQLAALLREDPKHADALLLQGQVLEWQGRYADAKRSYSAVLAFDAANAEARLRLDKLLWVK